MLHEVIDRALSEVRARPTEIHIPAYILRSVPDAVHARLLHPLNYSEELTNTPDSLALRAIFQAYLGEITPAKYYKKPARSLGKRDRRMVLPSAKRRVEIATDLNIDPRPVNAGLMDPLFVGYNAAVKRCVDSLMPTGTKRVGLALAGRTDWSNLVMSSGVTDAIFIDNCDVPPDKREFEGRLELFRTSGRFDEGRQELNAREIYKREKRELNFMSIGLSHKPKPMCTMSHSILIELLAMGVHVDNADGSPNIKAQKHKDGHLSVTFRWAAHREEEREYTLHFAQANILDPLTFPRFLTEQLREGIDIIFFKAGLKLCKRYQEFLPLFADALNEGGVTITNDATFELGGNNILYCAENVLRECLPQSKVIGRDHMRVEELVEYERALAERNLNVFHQTSRFALQSLLYGWYLNLNQRL